MCAATTALIPNWGSTKFNYSILSTSLLSSFRLLLSTTSLPQHLALKGATGSRIVRNYDDNNYNVPCTAAPAGHIPPACSTPTWRLPSRAGRVVVGPEGVINMTLTSQSCSSLHCTGIRSPRSVIDSHGTTERRGEQSAASGHRGCPRPNVTASTPFLTADGFESVRYHHMDSPLKASLQAYFYFYRSHT